MKTFDLGPIRPTSESASMLLRVTKGCAWNKCKFCNNYRTEKFSLRPLSVLKEEVDAVAAYRDRILQFRKDGEFDMKALNNDYRKMPSYEAQSNYNLVFNWISAGEYTIFLQDADALTVNAAELTELLLYVRKTLPETTRITSYSRPDTLARKSLDELKALKDAGLSRIHSGFESGHPEVLRRIMKGVTPEQQIKGGRNVMESGIELSVFLMAGVGGKALSEENAAETARVINAVDPNFVRLRTAVVIKGTPLWDDWIAGSFDECTDLEQLYEMRQFLSHIENCTGEVFTDHMVNLMTEIEGPLSEKDAFISYIDGFLSLPREQQRRYQLAKRLGFGGTYKQMELLSASECKSLDKYLDNLPDGPRFEEFLKDQLRKYI